MSIHQFQRFIVVYYFFSDILVKYSGSRNPTSWKDREGKLIKQRSLADATSTLMAIRQRIVNGESFAKLATTESDCGSAANGGDLGPFGHGCDH